MNQEIESPFLKASEVAEYLRSDYQTIIRMLKKGKLSGFKVGGSWRIRKEAVEALFT